MGIATAMKMNEARVFLYGHGLGVDGDENGRGGFHVLNTFVFIRGDAEALAVREGLARAGIFVPILYKPLAISDDGVVKADQDGLHVPGDLGLQGLIGEIGAVEDGIDEGKGGFFVGVGWRLGHYGLVCQPEADQYEENMLHILANNAKIP